MTMIRKMVRAEVNVLGEDEVEVVMSTAAIARDGHVLVPQGARLDNYRANPIFLWSHDPDKPIGNVTQIDIEPDQIRARVKFAPLGISPKADEIRGLMKAGVVRAVSVGFDPLEGEPLNPAKPRGGQRFTDWELLELSAVSVPADASALVTARAHGDAPMTDTPTEPAASADGARTRAAPARAMRGTRSSRIAFTRGLYQVAQLCYMFEELGWQVDMAKWEAMVEGDASKVPAMLAGVLGDLGEALLAMTEEEIAEALAGHDVEADGAEDDDVDEVLVVEERQHIRATTSPAVRAFRRGIAFAKLRAGKTLSAETVRCLRDAKAQHEEAMDLTRSAMRKHKSGVGAIDDMLDRAGVSDPESDATQEVQTSDGTGVDAGSEGQRAQEAFQRRQADLQSLRIAD